MYLNSITLRLLWVIYDKLNILFQSELSPLVCCSSVHQHTSTPVAPARCLFQMLAACFLYFYPRYVVFSSASCVWSTECNNTIWPVGPCIRSDIPIYVTYRAINHDIYSLDIWNQMARTEFKMYCTDIPKTYMDMFWLYRGRINIDITLLCLHIWNHHVLKGFVMDIMCPTSRAVRWWTGCLFEEHSWSLYTHTNGKTI